MDQILLARCATWDLLRWELAKTDEPLDLTVISRRSVFSPLMLADLPETNLKGFGGEEIHSPLPFSFLIF